MPSWWRKFFRSDQPTSGRTGYVVTQAPAMPGGAGHNDLTVELPASEEQPRSSGDVFREKGSKLAETGDYDGAIVMYNAALQCQASDTAALLYRSFAHMLSTSPNLDLAIQDANAAIQYDSANWKAWEQKGELLRRKGDPQAAVEALQNAVGFAQGTDRFAAQRSLDAARVACSHFSRAELSPTNSPTSQPGSGTLVPAATSTAPSGPPDNTQNAAITPPPPQPTLGTPIPPATNSTSSSPPYSTQNGLSSPANPSTAATTPDATASSTFPNSATILPSGGNATSSMQQSHDSRTRNISQPACQPPVTRAYNGSTVAQSPASTLPLSRDDLIDLTEPPNEAPPEYTQSTSSGRDSRRTMTNHEVETRIAQLQTAMVVKNKGSLSVRPYTSVGSIDAVQLLYIGMTVSELTSREVGLPTFMHQTFNRMVVEYTDLPKSTFPDMDCESSPYYEGKNPGTVSINGYSEEYREHQLVIAPILSLALEGPSCFEAVPLDTVVNHIRRVQLQPTLEDDESLKVVLGLSQLQCLQWGFSPTGTRQKRIDSICMALTRSLYTTPTRFIDFSKARTFSNNTLGSAAQGIGLQNFLFQILIGAELLIRLRKEPATTSYTSIVTDNISALTALSALWMQSVTIRGPNAALQSTSPRYMLYAHDHQRQAEGLIRFAEAMAWPFMNEARNYIENAYQDLTSGSGTVGFDICDWLFGLILPGKIFRHRIMSCLVYASPSIRSLNAAPYWENGIVVQNKSYWPKRTVLGRVLGGLRNPKSVCGWIGPVPAPVGNVRGWIRLNARRVDVPVPVVRSPNPLESFGFDQPEHNNSSEEIIESITDANEWIQPTPPSRASNDTSRSAFKGIELTLIPPAQNQIDGAISHLPQEQYRAVLDFEVSGVRTRYTLFANPVFVAAPPCVGSHTLHRRQAQKYLRRVVRVADLKESYPASDQLLVIDALGDGEEAVARAWCAERARHAVVRRGEGCCFACAVRVTVGSTGLNVNILIWSR